MKKNKKLKFISIVVLFAVMMLIVYAFSIFKVFTDSMEPNILKGSYILTTNKFGYKKGDVVLVKFNDEILLKRIIAVSGEKVEIDEIGNVLINDKFFYEPYISKKSLNPISINQPYYVPEDSFFIMGDKRERSYDSRMEEIKSIKSNLILGKVILNIKP